MFETIAVAPPDAILGLNEAFKADRNPNKINLGVGVYKDEQGQTPILNSVKEAETLLLKSEQTKSYLPIDGPPDYGVAVQKMLFGPDHEILTSGRAVTAQSPGGTGALRVAADFIHQQFPNSTVWLSDPTWPNHPSIFGAASVKIATYPYFNSATNDVDFSGMMNALDSAQKGDVVLIHGCCHNPTGVDLSAEAWQQLADQIQQKGLLPLLDFAYQGFAEGLDEDAVGLRTLSRPGAELFIASSFSKNFGLYNERTGAITLVAASNEPAQVALSQLKRCIRANYSNPPAHGSAIVTTILTQPELRTKWASELTAMRERINGMRHLFVETLNEKGVKENFSFITQQRGMFSYSGLTTDHVAALRDRHGVYIVGSGRINVAGMTAENMDYLCSAIADVLSNEK
ncbi:MAG: amino acid aminotransferase [Chloroflexota bacterium]